MFVKEENVMRNKLREILDMNKMIGMEMVGCCRY